MPAGYTTNDGRFEVIRPLIECAEREIGAYAELKGFPILPCNLCGSQSDLKRVDVAHLLQELERKNPDVRQVMLAAMKNVRPTHLLDREVAEAWTRCADDYQPRR
jgi:tRNA 2-thiocytidine biosynthesis protein TtcA